jgi:hypothetical protein
LPFAIVPVCSTLVILSMYPHSPPLLCLF